MQSIQISYIPIKSVLQVDRLFKYVLNLTSFIINSIPTVLGKGHSMVKFLVLTNFWLNRYLLLQTKIKKMFWCSVCNSLFFPKPVDYIPTPRQLLATIVRNFTHSYPINILHYLFLQLIMSPKRSVVQGNLYSKLS